jgi:hypothetical protein
MLLCLYFGETSPLETKDFCLLIVACLIFQQRPLRPHSLCVKQQASSESSLPIEMIMYLPPQLEGGSNRPLPLRKKKGKKKLALELFKSLERTIVFRCEHPSRKKYRGTLFFSFDRPLTNRTC